MAAVSPRFFSSGDLIADRRYEYARDLLIKNDCSAALDLLLQALEQVPSFASAWFMLGEIREQLGLKGEAIKAYRQALASDAEDRPGAGLRLKRLGAPHARAAMSAGYVRALFDQYAPRFDKALEQDLDYAGPRLLFDAVFEACGIIGRERWFDRALDLGCGTGLAGAAFACRIDALHGIDLSPRMAEFAHRRGCYSDVQVGDMLDYLRAQGDDGADLLIAADSMVYVDELAPLFTESARVLEQHGLFALTLETHAGAGVVLGEKLRYAHAADYVRHTAEIAGLVPVVFRHASTRTEGGTPVPGLLIIAEQRSRPPPPATE
jgi:predicted TPR repeat methyltransferase